MAFTPSLVVLQPVSDESCLQVDGGMQHQQQVQMGMSDANPQMLLGSGGLSDAVSAAMHAVPSGNVYWGDAAVQAGPGMSAQDMAADAEGLQHQGALQPHLAGQALPPCFFTPHSHMLTKLMVSSAAAQVSTRQRQSAACLH